MVSQRRLKQVVKAFFPIQELCYGFIIKVADIARPSQLAGMDGLTHGSGNTAGHIHPADPYGKCDGVVLKFLSDMLIDMINHIMYPTAYHLILRLI